MTNETVVVSVVCNAFNHGKYIAQTLEGFVMQKTNFAFEVLVHDDASTDNTADLIRQYAEQYPDIIKPYYQTENQYSKRVPITRKFQYSRAVGKYIALCEGDDYWIDPYKLQKQVDAMEAHPEVDICSHRAQAVLDGKIDEIFPKAQGSDILTADQVINGGGSFVATNSLMMRRDFIDSHYDYTKLYNLDYIIQVSGSLRGGMLFLNDVMSAYRKMAEGSWSQRSTKNVDWLAAHRKKIRDILLQMDADTDYVHTAAIQRSLASAHLRQLARQGDLKMILSSECRAEMKTQPFIQKGKIIFFAAYMAVRKKK